MRRSLFLLAFFSAATMSSAPARATYIAVNYDSVFVFGYDTYNFFGTGTDLTGKTVNISYLFDDQTPGLQFTDLGNLQRLEGYGPDFGSLGSPGIATVTVNGITLFINGSFYSGITKYDNGMSDSVQAYAGDRIVGPGSSYYLAAASVSMTGSDYISNPNLYDTLSVSTGSFTYSDANVQYNVVNSHGSTIQSVSGRVVGTAPARITFQSNVNAPAVPEPSTWLMMLTGFALVGGALRQRAVRTFSRPIQAA